MIEIRLLGEQLVATGAQPGRRRPSSRSAGLLAYLVLHAGIGEARPHLAGNFWPDSTESQARTNLRRELHELRVALGDCPSLVIEPTTLTWCDTPACRVDVRVFYAEREAAFAARSRDDGDEFLRHADAAIAEYRGELMPGVYDDWLLDHRDRVRRECVDLCDLAAAGRRVSGDHGRAIEIARRRIHLEPLEELGYRLLMEIQAESGDRAAAMGTYHRCAAMLEQELGVSPDPETTRGLERLLERGDTPVRPPLRPSWRPEAAGAALVGRENEVGQLLRRWRQSALGQCGLVVVSGEPGVGKSRLVAELSAEAGDEGAVVAMTRCFASSGQLALAPIAEWLRSSDLRSAVATLEPVWQLEVERLVPDTDDPRSGTARTEDRSPTDVGPGTAPGASRAMVDAWRRHRFFEGLARAVLAANIPTLLVLDDMQWCDQETLAWLAFLMSFANDAPLLVIATLRPEELDDNRDVGASLWGLRSAGLVTDIALGPLNVDESGELAASLLGRRLSAAEQTFLHAAAGGNPLLVVEAARSFSDSTSSVHPMQGADLQGVLDRRLAQPSPAAREVAGLAAALGRDFSLDLLSEASDLDADTLVQAVDELWRLRILREQRNGYDFSHDLLRDAAYASVSPPRRWLLHRRLAQGLELLHAGRVDDVAAQLAEQYERGGRPDRALHYFGRAAQAAAGLFAYTEAIRSYRRCLALVEQMPAGRERDNRELDVLGQISEPLNAVRGYSSTELQSTLERSAVLAERLGRRHVLQGNLVALFAARFVQGRTALAHKLATRALALAEGGAEREFVGQAHFAFAGSATSLGMAATAIPHFDLADELSRGAFSFLLGTRIEVHARAWAAHAHWLLGEDDRAAAACVGAVERGRAVDHPYSLAVALAYAAITYQMHGDRPAVRAAVEELRGLCDRYEFAYYSEWARVLDGWACGGEQGVARIQEGIGRLRSLRAYARMPYWLSLLGEVLIGCRRTEAARAVLDAARAAAEENDDRWWLPEVLRLRAGLESGEPAVARLRAAVELADKQRSRALEARSRADLMDRVAP
jgi:DNA-binding SARP family transcriptional activator